MFSEDDRREYSPVDLNLEVHKAIVGKGWPRLAIEIKNLQLSLAEHISGIDNIFLMHGSIELSDTDKDSWSVKYTDASGTYGNFTIESPKLIMIAEGSKSETRGKFSDFIAVEKPKEIFVSGTISLEGIFDFEKNQSTGHVTVVVDLDENVGSFGALRPKTKDLFLNSEQKDNINSSHEILIQKAAFNVLKNEQKYFKEINLPNNYQDLKVKHEECFSTEITFGKASKVVLASNVVLSGDSVRNGSIT